VAITYKIDEGAGIVSFRFSHYPTVDDYQEGFSQALEQVEAAHIDRWLVWLDYDELTLDTRSLTFSKEIALDINRYISKLAVVCPIKWHSREKIILELIRNQFKEVKIFVSVQDARKWLLE